jgi:hypothetical protein
MLNSGLFRYVGNASPCGISACYYFQKRNSDVCSSFMYCEKLVTCRYLGAAVFPVEALLYFWHMHPIEARQQTASMHAFLYFLFFVKVATEVCLVSLPAGAGKDRSTSRRTQSRTNSRT